MSVGAYLKTVLSSSVAVSNRYHSSHLSHWRFLLGGLVGSLMLCAAVSASSLSSNDDASGATFANPDTIEDGTYLYGSAPESDVLGAAYMVFAAQDSYLVGAMFMPQSSFDCFQGHRDGNELALQITNSYTQEVYGYAIALVTDAAPIAAANGTGLVLALDGFYNLGTPGESELAILSTCQAHQSIVETEL